VSDRSADICILGSGVAGLLLAERLIERAPGQRVLVVERGTALTHEQRFAQGSHKDPLPFNRSPIRLPHAPPPRGPRTRWDRRYPFWPVYNLGGCTNHFFGNLPRMHPAHFEQEAFGGADRRWPITYAELEPYYLQAERRLRVSGSSERVPFQGRFGYPLAGHRLSPADRACETLFGPRSVVPMPTTRGSESVDGRPACCGTNKCDLCPVEAKGTALNTVYPSIRDRVEWQFGWMATELQHRSGRVRSVVALDAKGARHRIEARTFIVACNGVDSCLLLQRSPTLPRLPALGRYYMDHPAFEIAIYDTGLDARPGYGDNPQTGMLLTFFERVSRDLPISMLGEIRPGAFSLNDGEMTRDVLLRDLLARALAGAADDSFRARLQSAWRGSIDLLFIVEQQPRAEHTLEIDRIEPTGQAVPRLHLTYPQYLTDCIKLVLARARAAAPKARVRHLATFPSSYHWMGATRMSTSDETGCVDAALRLHSAENAYVLSTSVFPSSSSANPTLALAALALRLGDHLGERATGGTR
jgi:choline dehydrogenase-like flavoprotein